MPTIIPALPTPPKDVNAPGSFLVETTTTLAAGDYLNGVNLSFLLAFEAQTGGVVFTNAGTLWLTYAGGNNFGGATLIGGFSMGRIVNTGDMVINGSVPEVYGIANGSTWDGLLNTGRMWTINTSGSAIGVSTYSSADEIRNEGLFAVSGATGAAGIVRNNGGDVVNTASGQILVEAAAGNFIGVAFLRWGTLDNAGLIETNALGTGQHSYAVFIAGGDFASTITNSGTIRSDEYAIYATDQTGFSPPTDGPQTVTNTASGQIFGHIALSSGDDVINNAGAITGDIDLGSFIDSLTNSGTIIGAVWAGHGDEVIDTRTGTISGVVMLEGGDDTFLGSALADRVSGGVMSDWLEGFGGDDLLVGGYGHDTLIGGAGNDGLYGELGNDVIQTAGGDLVLAGLGDDRIELGDLTFASIDGGEGYDRLVLPTGALSLDLGLVAASGRVSGIDALVMRGGQTLSLTGADAASLSGSNQLRVESGAGDTVNLVGSWADGGMTNIGGTSWHLYTSGGNQVLVAGGGAVQIVASVPGGASGLAAVAGGGAAPTAGGASGIELAANTFTFDSFSLSDRTVVNAGETWIGTGYAAIDAPLQFRVITLTNNGTIRSDSIVPANGGVPSVFGVRTSIQGIVNNNGLIEVIGNWRWATGVQISQGTVLNNAGQIVVTSDVIATGATVLSGDMFHNTGTINVTTGDTAKGVEVVSSGSFVNDGTIVVTGLAAIGANLNQPFGTMVNNGTIQVTSTSLTDLDFRSQGVVLHTFYGNFTFANHGTIQAVTAIRVASPGSNVSARIENSGTILGNIVMQESNDTVVNTGLLTGTVYLGSGNDTFDGRGGTQSGGVFGGTGNDTYKVDTQAVLIYENGDEGTDTVETGIGYYLFDNVENLLLTGSGSVFGVGNGLANVLTGNSGANLLIAGAGDDTVSGGAGNDQLFGEDGSDTLNGEAGIDFIAAGSGNDFVYGGNDADNLFGEDGDDLLDGGDSFDTDILTGGAGNDILDGNSGQANPDYDLMDGGSGDDTYHVDTGADLTFEALGGGIDTVHANVTVPNAGVYLYANVENLVLEGTTAFGVGNELDNQLTGSASGNWLLGGLGADRINGGTGNDVLFGEGGADTFVFGAGSGADVIGDFSFAQDVIEFRAYFTTFAQAQASFVQVGVDGAIDLGNGEVIILLGVTLASLTAANFVFAPLAEPLAAPKSAPVIEPLSFGRDAVDSVSFTDHCLERWQAEFHAGPIHG